MRINRKVVLIVIIVVIGIAAGVLFSMYSRQVADQKDLDAKLDRARVLTVSLTGQKKDAEDKLASAESLLEQSRAKFPTSVESIEYGEYLFDIAEDCGVTLESLKFPTPVEKKVGSVTYSVVSLSLPVSGPLDNIFDFISTIRTDPRFASTELKTVNLDVGGTRAIITLDIYGYKG